MALTSAALLKIAKTIVFPIITKVLGNSSAARNLTQQIEMELISLDKTTIQAQASIIMAEATGTLKQRNWRPDLMYAFIYILYFLVIFVPLFNGIVVPLVLKHTQLPLQTINPKLVWSSIPTEFWYFITVCVGGYIGGRSYEKGKEAEVRIARENESTVTVRTRGTERESTPFNRMRRSVGKSTPVETRKVDPVRHERSVGMVSD